MHSRSFSASLRRQRGQGGAVLVGQGLSLVLVVLALAGLIIFGAQQLQRVKTSSTAQQMKPLVTAAGLYLDQYSSEVTSLLSPGGAPVVIPVAKTSPGGQIPTGPALSGGGYLPSLQGADLVSPNYVDKDAFGQSHDLVVLEPVAGQYEALILSTGGAAASNEQVGQIAAAYPGVGGAIMSPNQGLSQSALGKIDGIGRSWSLSLASLNISSDVAEPGHYAVLLPNAMSAGRVNQSNFISRKAIPGGGGSTMTTDILMNGNSLSNLGSVGFGSGASISVPSAGTISLSGAAKSQGNMAVASNASLSKNLSVGGTLSSGVLNAGSGAVSGAASAGSLAIGGSMAVGGGLTGSSMNAGSVTVNNTLTASNSATASGAATFGGLNVANNMNVGGSLTAAHLVPTANVVQGASCPNLGAYATGRYTDAAGRSRVAQMFCEPSVNGNVWQGGVTQAGYEGQTYVKPICPTGPGWTGNYTWGGSGWVSNCNYQPQPACPAGYGGSYSWNGSSWVDGCTQPMERVRWQSGHGGVNGGYSWLFAKITLTQYNCLLSSQVPIPKYCGGGRNGRYQCGTQLAPAATYYDIYYGMQTASINSYYHGTIDPNNVCGF